jgi:hypothetical protein
VKRTLSRSQLIGGILATGAVAACGGGGSPAVAPTSASLCAPLPASTASLSQIFSDPIFAALDIATLDAAFNSAANIELTYAGYYLQAGRQLQSSNVIISIPPAGIIIQSPGTYTFGNDVTWSPANVQCSAITIAANNVTLDFAGHTLTANLLDKSQQIAGVLVGGTVITPYDNIRIQNGAIANASEYGILATSVCGLQISNVTVSGICMNNLNTRFLTPAGINVSASLEVTITNCTVKNQNVTTDSSAGIFLNSVLQGTVSNCLVSGLVNNDGAIQGYGYIQCMNVTTTVCRSESLQSHFNGNILTTGHTVLGFCPIICSNLSYVNCSASGITGCCDDTHAMSVFLDSQVTVSGFQADNVTDGVTPANTGAKATGLEVYGVGVQISNCSVTAIKAINPQDLQAAGFSAWGLDIQFIACQASAVSVVDDLSKGCKGVGFGWAPDPRTKYGFAQIGAYDVTYANCIAVQCNVGFDTFNHVNSTWINPTYTNCGVGILVEPGVTRTLTCDGCSECNPSLSTPVKNLANGNTYPS